MNSSSPTRSRSRLARAVVATAAVCAGSLTPLLAGSAGAATTPPPTPAVVAPTSTAAGLKEVVLDWTPAVGATSYVVEVDTDGEWSDAPTLSRTTVATRFTLPTWLPHASYVWRVAAVGAGGQSRWSANGTFTRAWSAKPTPLSPVGTPSPVPGVVTFSWTPVPTASEYQLQVSTSPYFDAAFGTQADSKTESCFTTRTSITPFNSQVEGRNPGAGDCEFTLLGTGEPRYWRVRPLDQISGDVPQVNTTPVVDEGISSLPPAKAGELDTSACPEPLAGSASTPVVPGSSTETAGSCEPANEVEKGRWSAGVAFTDTAPPIPDPVPAYRDLVRPDRPFPAPTLSQDVCAGDLCRDFPTISWGHVDGAQRYRLYVALDADFTNIHDIVETRGNSWTPPYQWRDSTAGAHYYVVVQPCTVLPAEDGSRAGCDEPSEPVLFRKSSAKLALTAPAHGAFVGGSEVALSWQAASSASSAATGWPATSEAAAYRVQVTRPTNPDFLTAGLVEDVVLDSTTHVSALKRYADGVHLWRVQPIDASGHRLPWSATRTFTRDGTAPTATVSPAVVPARGPFTVRFSEPVTGVGPGSIALSGVAVTVTPSADRRSATVTPTRALLPGASHTLAVGGQVRDDAGNPVVPTRRAVVVDPTVDDRSPLLALSGSWQRLAATDAVAGTFSRSAPTTRTPTTATVRLTGRAVEVRGCVGPSNGVFEVWVDGARVARVDGYRSYSGCGVVLSRAATVPGSAHVVQVRGTGLKHRSSKGTAVAVDAVVAVR